MTQSFRTTVDGKVLWCRHGFQVSGIVALQAGDESNADAAGEKRIFAVGFLTTAPARITRDSDVGRPEGKAVVPAGISVLDGVVVFGTGFGRDDIGDAIDEVGVPGCGEADGLRENGGDSRARDAVQALVPPVIGGNSKARVGASNVMELGGLFLQRNAGIQIIGARFNGNAGVRVVRVCSVRRSDWCRCRLV